MSTGIDIGTLIGIMAATFALTTAIIGFLVRQLLRSYKAEAEQRLITIQTEYGEKLISMSKTVVDISQDRKDCEDRERNSTTKLERLVERCVDQWAEFKQVNATVEATRGRRLDALFNVVDHWKDEVRNIKPAMFAKLEELHQHSAQELQRDLRMELKEYVQALLKKNGI